MPDHSLSPAYPQDREPSKKAPSWAKVHSFIKAMHETLKANGFNDDALCFDAITSSILHVLIAMPVKAGAEVMVRPPDLAAGLMEPLNEVTARFSKMAKYAIITWRVDSHVHVNARVRLLLHSKGGRFKGQPTGRTTDIAAALIWGRP